MTGILIVTHGDLGKALIDAAGFILGTEPDAVIAISIDLNEKADALRKKIAKGLDDVKTGDGALILTDMFGGSPSNLSYSFLEEGVVEVLSGVNLPIVLKAIRGRQQMELSALAAEIEDYGKKSISLASGILKGNKRG
jgi:mannose PTS system EIIA component